MARPRKILNINSEEEVHGQKNFKDIIRFKNEEQKLAWEILDSNVDDSSNNVPNYPVTFLLGPAGSSKTFISVAYAIYDLLRNNKKKIYVSRPLVESGESMGFLKGSVSEKVAPHMASVLESVDRLTKNLTLAERNKVNNAVEIIPLAFIRGKTFYSDTISLLDEAQNCTKATLKTYLTRIGEGGKMIINGDLSQADIFNSGLKEVVSKLGKIPEIGIFEFSNEAIVRHPLIGKILEKLA